MKNGGFPRFLTKYDRWHTGCKHPVNRSLGGAVAESKNNDRQRNRR